MKALFYILFTLLVFINTHVNAEGKNETLPNQNQHQNKFLVQTTLTKEQIETLLKQYNEKNNLENPSQVEQIHLKVKKQKSKKNHKKEKALGNGTTELEVPQNETVPSEQIGNESETVSFGIFDFFDDLFDSEDPEPQNETENGTIPENADTSPENKVNENKEIKENEVIPGNVEAAPENTANENKEIPESTETAVENSAKENEQVTLLSNDGSTKTANTQSGMTISGFFSVVLLTIAFGLFLVYATQPKKKNKNYSKSFNGIKIGF